MRKAALVIVLCLWWSSTLLAGPVTQCQALGRAMEMAVRLTPQGVSPQLDCKWVATESMPFYAFDIGEEKGFVLVAGDDRGGPILGYSDKGHFDWDEMPPALRTWLGAYQDHLTSMVDSTYCEPAFSPARVKEKPRNAIAPLLSANWSQHEPYYNSCPEVSGEFCNTGCAATAMAQLVYHHRARCAQELLADIKAYTCSTSWPNYGKVSVPGVAKGTPLDFGHMLDNYMGGESEVERKAVADLMFFCAASLSTEFVPPSKGASSAAPSSMPSALKKYFGFSKECCFKERGAYSITQWEDMVYNEVKEGRPVVYVGRSENYSHAFIIDGYDGDLLYHVNWGWSGLYNGYYNLSLLSSVEGSTSNGYTMSQGALIGAQPAYEEEMSATLSTYNFTLTGSKMGYTVTNYTDGADYFKFGISAVLHDGTFQLLDGTSNYVALGDRSTLTVTLTLTKNDLTALPPGEYVLKPVFNRKNENIWRFADCSDEFVFCLAWDGSNFSLSLNSPSNDRTFTADAFSFPANVVKGTKIPVSATLSCHGGEYSNEVYLFASTTSSASTYASRTGVYLKDGEQCEVSLSFTPSTTGKYNVWIATDAKGTTSIGGCTVNVSTASSSGELSVVDYQVENAEKSGEWNTVYGKILKGTITLKNTGASLYSDIVTIWLMKGSTKSYFVGSTSNRMLVTLAPGETMTMDYAYDEGETGNYYQLWLMKNNVLITNGKVRFFHLVPGITTYDASGNSKSVAPNSAYKVPDEVCAVDLEGAGVTKVTLNTNPNTVFFLGESDAVPSGLNGKNVVKAGVAETVTLTDGYPFYIPRTYHANTISYTRTPRRQTSGKGGWETIVLPFAVQEVTNVTDNKAIDWFHSSTDSNKDFWLKEYALQDTETGVAYFDHVDIFLPHIPYIMAVPSSRWGASHDLTGKQLRFSADDVEITADAKLLSKTSVYRFEGTYVKKTMDDVFVLNDLGTSFARTGSAEVMPFRAWFAESGPGAIHSNISIGDFDSVTEIGPLPSMEDEEVDIHSLSGVKVRTVKVHDGNVDTEGLPKGVYVVRGRKIIVR